MKQPYWMKGLLTAFLVFLLLVPAAQTARAAGGVALPPAALSAQPTPAPRAPSRPYAIMISLEDQQATVLTYDLNGQYTVPVRTFWCSTARKGKITPVGTFQLGSRYRWLSAVGNVYVQYAIRFKGVFLLHSVPFLKRDPATMIYSEYNMLGQPASAGCVRFQTADIKWIYDHCAQGTPLIIARKTAWPTLACRAGLALLPDGLLGWDPSDPDAANAFPAGTTAAPLPTPAP